MNRRVKLRELEVGRNRFCENTVEKCHFLSPLLEEVKLHVSLKFSSSNLDQEGVDSKNTNVGCELTVNANSSSLSLNQTLRYNQHLNIAITKTGSILDGQTLLIRISKMLFFKNVNL